MSGKAGGGEAGGAGAGRGPDGLAPEGGGLADGGLDWAGLLRVGLLAPGRGGLGLRPAEFWALTPAELALMLGIEPGAGGMTRARLAEMAARFESVPGGCASGGDISPQAMG